MKIVSATKNITENYDGYGVIVSITYENGDSYKVSYEETPNHSIRLEAPMKWMCCVNGLKERLSSFGEKEVTKELVDKIDNVLSLFSECDGKHQRVYL